MFWFVSVSLSNIANGLQQRRDRRERTLHVQVRSVNFVLYIKCEDPNSFPFLSAYIIKKVAIRVTSDATIREMPASCFRMMMPIIKAIIVKILAPIHMPIARAKR